MSTPNDQNAGEPGRGRGGGPEPIGPPVGVVSLRRGGLYRPWLVAAIIFGNTLLGTFTPLAHALDPRRALTQYQSRTWGPEEGLPCHDVLAVTQTSDGYLWLGTEEGLVRFDGVRARVFDRQSDPLLGGNNVAAVVEDPRRPGEILLCSAVGLTRMVNGKVQDFCSGEKFPSPPGGILLRDPADGALWVRALSGLFRVTPDGHGVSGPLEADSGWPVETINTLCRDAAGRLWLGTARGLYRQHDGGPGKEAIRFDLLPGWANKKVDFVTAARAGGVWVGSKDAGSGWLDPTNTFRPRAALAGCVVSTLIEDRAGTVWVGTNGSGLFRLAGEEAPEATPAFAVLTTTNGLIYNQVNGLCEDREGNLWVATARGLQVLRDAPLINYGLPEGLAGEDVRTVWEDPRGRLWIGHERGLSMREPSGEGATNYPTPPSARRPGDNRVLCVGPGEEVDTLWVGTHAGLLRWREGRLEAWSLREDFDGATVRALAVDLAGNHWVGTDRGLYQVRGGQIVAHLTKAGGLKEDSVRALHFDGRGNLWMGVDGGISRRGADGEVANFAVAEPGRPAVGVLAIAEDPDQADDLLVGTNAGLHRLHALGEPGGRITRYPTGDALVDDMLWGVLDDGRGRLWIASNRGIARMVKADLDRFDRKEISSVPFLAYGTAEGMRSRECNGGVQPCAWRDHAGRLWFATVRGAAVVDPAHVDPRLRFPPVRVEGLVADGRPMATDPAGPGGEAPSPALAAGTQKLDFRYTALSLVSPETIRFRTRLEPFENRWTEVGTERVAHYTNLPPGGYTFRVQAASADGIWNEGGASLAFQMQPFWFQRGWFRALVPLAVLALWWAAHQWHRRRWQARLVRAEAELTERTRTQEVLRHAMEAADTARQEAERANAAKSEFLSRMSHELRTPLNAILGFGQLLEMSPLDPRDGQSVGHILKGGRHLLGLIDEVLDIARIESGRLELSVEAVTVDEVVAETLSLLGPLAASRRVTLSHHATQVGHRVLADRQRLKQVLINLLSNAVKYHHREGGWVILEGGPAEGRADRVRFGVRDNGPGIAPELLPRLFVPFERLDAAQRGIDGVGIGLTICRQLVAAMGGTIQVDSVPGRGTTFAFDLPVAPVPVNGTPGPNKVSGGGQGETPPPWSTRTMLHIEDDPACQSLVERACEGRPDLRLLATMQGRLGLDLAREHRPDLILLDLELPDLGGEDVLRRLRSDPQTAHIPVLVLSADSTARQVARLRQLGARHYLCKPLRATALLQALDETLGEPEAFCPWPWQGSGSNAETSM